MQVTVNNSPILDYSHLNDHINNAIGVDFKLICNAAPESW